jgi:hypothetical protein
MVEYRPLELGARLMAGQLSLEQSVVVRIHCPQPHIWRYTAPKPPPLGVYGKILDQLEQLFCLRLQ